MIVMATEMTAKYKEKPAERDAPPVKGFDAGVRGHLGCPADHPDLHGLLCRKILKHVDVPAILLRASAQIRMTISVILVGPHPHP